MAELPDPGTFGAAFQEFMRAMSLAADHGESDIVTRLREHLGTDPRELPTTAIELPITEQANLQLAIDAVLGDAEVLGIATPHEGFMPVGLTNLLSGAPFLPGVGFGPVRYSEIDVGDGRVIRCVTSALLLVRHGDAPVALLLSRTGDHPMQPAGIKLEGISPQAGAVSEVIAALRAAMRAHNVFRGQIISLHQSNHGAVSVQFHAVPAVTRDAVVLPAGTMERLERHALGIAQQADTLRAAGRHLKRGVLLHGPPGTGKTLSVSYLLTAMAGRTTILLTGRGLGLIEQALTIARELAPATVVFEDVDLVATERTMPPFGGGDALFELLNQMEGLAEDEDLLFVLTTNRPDLIEPALAARPGRIDLALEIPLPDDEGRLRLLALYGDGLGASEDGLRELAARSAGVSGAFVKELMRQVWLRASLDGREPGLDVARAVLDELLDERATLTRRLLGQAPDGSTAGDGPPPSMAAALAAAGLTVPPSA